jgi:acetyl esterase/lipase
LKRSCTDMRIEDYPPQEPFSDFATPYVAEVLRRGADVVPTEEVQYGDDPYQSIAIHAASVPKGDVFAFVHGGGWTSGYKEQMNFMAPAFTAAGVTFCSIGYRLAPQHIFPKGLEDVADALSWIFRNIHHLEAGAPPFLLAYGTKDFVHLQDQAERMVTALSEANIAVDKIVFDGLDHFGASLAGGEPDGPWVSRAIDWMAKL